MRISDWSSDVCSSDLDAGGLVAAGGDAVPRLVRAPGLDRDVVGDVPGGAEGRGTFALGLDQVASDDGVAGRLGERIATDHELGKASCRERWYSYVMLPGVAALHTKKYVTQDTRY